MRQIPLATPIALAVLAACGGGARPPETTPAPPPAVAAAPAAHPTAPGARADAIVTGRPIIPETWSLAGKGVAVPGPQAMIVSGHPLASQVGIEIIQQGGNAVDAGGAAGFARGGAPPGGAPRGGGGFSGPPPPGGGAPPPPRGFPASGST